MECALLNTYLVLQPSLSLRKTSSSKPDQKNPHWTAKAEQLFRWLSCHLKTSLQACGLTLVLEGSEGLKLRYSLLWTSEGSTSDPESTLLLSCFPLQRKRSLFRCISSLFKIFAENSGRVNDFHPRYVCCVISVTTELGFLNSANTRVEL